MSIDRRQVLVTALAAPFVWVPRARAGDMPSRIKFVFKAQPTMEGQGATVKRLFPTQSIRHLDPFVLLDHFSVKPPAGFPMHPHKGFEAFTYMLQGSFHHKDTLGNDSRIHAGGIQRFTSGRGARHSEMPGPGAANDGLQLWVNLPRKLKKMPPEYAGLPAKKLDVRQDDTLFVREIAETNSQAGLKTAIEYLDILFRDAAPFQAKAKAGWNTLVYVISGSVKVQGKVLGTGSCALLDKGLVAVAPMSSGARVAYLSGKPHDEPIIQRGPFVL